MWSVGPYRALVPRCSLGRSSAGRLVTSIEWPEMVLAYAPGIAIAEAGLKHAI